MASLFSAPGALFEDFDQLRREMDAMWGSAFGPASIRAVASGSFPALNVGVSADSVDVYLLAPGLDLQKVDVSLEDHVLTVSGERPIPKADGRAYLRERYGGAFRRAVTLAEDIDPDRVNAHYENGILHIKVARKAQAHSRRIEVKQES